MVTRLDAPSQTFVMQAPDTVWLLGEDDTGGGDDGIYTIEMPVVDLGEPVVLSAIEYPVLAQIWDNDDDAVFDTL